MESRTDLTQLSEDQLRQMAAQLITQLGDQQAQHAAELSQRDKTLKHYKIRKVPGRFTDEGFLSPNVARVRW